MRILAVPSLVALLAAALLAEPAAPAGPSARAAVVRVHVTPHRVHAGGLITVTGSGWPRRRSVELLIGVPYSEATRIAVAHTTSRGTFSRRVRLWRRMDPGRWVVLACRRACRIKVAANVIVTR